MAGGFPHPADHAQGGVPIVFDKAISFLETRFSVPGMGIEARRKRTFLAFSILAPIPFAALYGMNDLLAGRLFEGTIVIGVLLVLVTNLLLLKTRDNTTRHLRLHAGMLMVLMYYELSIGAGDGQVFVWFYAYPIVVFHLFGTGEGSAWVAVSIALSTAFLFFDAGQHRYPPDMALRYLVTYFIVSIVSCAVESSHRRCYKPLQEKSRVLE